MLKLSCGENWTIGLQSPKAGPGTSRCLIAVAVLPAGPSLTSRLTHPHLCTGPGSVPPGRARSQSAALRALPLGPGHQRHLSPIYSSELCALVPHSEAETRASNLLAP